MRYTSRTTPHVTCVTAYEQMFSPLRPNIANHNPQTMGKSKACYSALQRITAIYARLGAA
jgi:hypothetical protein